MAFGPLSLLQELLWIIGEVTDGELERSPSRCSIRSGSVIYIALPMRIRGDDDTVVPRYQIRVVGDFGSMTRGFPDATDPGFFNGIFFLGIAIAAACF